MAASPIASTGSQKIFTPFPPSGPPQKKELSPEDQKANRLVVIGNVLQILATIFAAAITITACITLTPLAFIAIIPCIGLHLLGAYMTHLPVEFAQANLIASLADRPLGLPNSGNNCFANAVLQFLVHDSDMNKLAKEATHLVDQGCELKQKELSELGEKVPRARSTFSGRILKAESWEDLDAIREDVRISEFSTTLKKAILGAIDNCLVDFLGAIEDEQERKYIKGRIDLKETFVEKRTVFQSYEQLRVAINKGWGLLKSRIDNAWQETLTQLGYVPFSDEEEGSFNGTVSEQAASSLESVPALSHVRELVLGYEEARLRGQGLATVQSGQLRSLLHQEKVDGPQEDPDEVLKVFLGNLGPVELGEYNSLVGPEILFHRKTEREDLGATFSVGREVKPILEVEFREEEASFSSLLQQSLESEQHAVESFLPPPAKWDPNKSEAENRIDLVVSKHESTRFIGVPSRITVQLKRFKVDEFGVQSKIEDRVKSPLSFELPARFCIPSETQGLPEYEIPLRGEKAAAFAEQCMVSSEREGKRAAKYELESFISHLGGSTTNGHYVFYTRKQGPDGPQWVCMNDSRVTLASVAAAERAAGTTGYLLRYVKVQGAEPPSSPSPSSQSVHSATDSHDD